MVVRRFDGPRRAQLRCRSSWHMGASRTDRRTGHISPRHPGRPVEPRRTAGTDCRRGRHRTRGYTPGRTHVRQRTNHNRVSNEGLPASRSPYGACAARLPVRTFEPYPVLPPALGGTAISVRALLKFVGAYEAGLEASASPAGRGGHVIRGSSHENAEWVSGRVGEHIQGLILVVGAVEQFSGTKS